MFNLRKEIFFITGASGFLGFQYSNFFCKLGAKVYAVDIVKNNKIIYLEKKYKNFFFLNVISLIKKNYYFYQKNYLKIMLQLY
jgi:nucleoside-diphosphate-sugar epimerase